MKKLLFVVVQTLSFPFFALFVILTLLGWVGQKGLDGYDVCDTYLRKKWGIKPD
jgi:hypothetical protein